MKRRYPARRGMLRFCVMAGCGFVLTGFALTCAQAQETTTYSYDALGRLVATNVNGGLNNGVVMRTCFDGAGNRTQYAVAQTGFVCPAPSPTPTPSAAPAP